MEYQEKLENKQKEEEIETRSKLQEQHDDELIQIFKCLQEEQKRGFDDEPNNFIVEREEELSESNFQVNMETEKQEEKVKISKESSFESIEQECEKEKIPQKWLLEDIKDGNPQLLEEQVSNLDNREDYLHQTLEQDKILITSYLEVQNKKKEDGTDSYLDSSIYSENQLYQDSQEQKEQRNDIQIDDVKIDQHIRQSSNLNEEGELYVTKNDGQQTQNDQKSQNIELNQITKHETSSEVQTNEKKEEKPQEHIGSIIKHEIVQPNREKNSKQSSPYQEDHKTREYHLAIEQGLGGVLLKVCNSIDQINPETLEKIKSTNKKPLDHEYYSRWKEAKFDNTEFIKIIAKTIAPNNKKFKKDIEKLFENIEFKINVKKLNGQEVSHDINQYYSDFKQKSFSINFFTKEVGKVGVEKLEGIVLKSNRIEGITQLHPHVILFPDVSVKRKSNEKITMKFVSIDNIYLQNNRWHFWRGLNQVVLVEKEPIDKTPYQIYLNAKEWMHTQHLSNTHQLQLKKERKDQLMQVEGTEQNNQMFNIKNTAYKQIALYLDSQYTLSSRKKGPIGICLPPFDKCELDVEFSDCHWYGGKNIRLNLEKTLKIVLRAQLKNSFDPRIIKGIGNPANIDKNTSATFSRKVGDYFYVMTRKNDKDFKMRSFSIRGTVKEYIVYLALKEKYLEKKITLPIKISRAETIQRANEMIKRLQIPRTSISKKYYITSIHSLRGQGLILTGSDNRVLRWMDTSDDVVKSYSYIIGQHYLKAITQSRQKFKKLYKSLLKAELISNYIDGIDIFNIRDRKIIAIPNWEFYYYNFDDGDIIKDMLQYHYRGEKMLPRFKPLKETIQNYVRKNRKNNKKVKVVKNDENISKIGLKLSKRYYALWEAMDGKSQHSFLEKYDSELRKSTNDPKSSILGNGFEGFQLKRSTLELKLRHEFNTSEDMYAINEENLKHKILSKGHSEYTINFAANQLIELIYTNNKRAFIFLDYYDKQEICKIYIGRFFNHTVKYGGLVKSEKEFEKMHYYSQFHHEIWKKIRNSVKTKHDYRFRLDSQILKKIREKVLPKVENKEVYQHWIEFESELLTFFGEDKIKNGIRKAIFDQWWIDKVKNSLS